MIDLFDRLMQYFRKARGVKDTGRAYKEQALTLIAYFRYLVEKSPDPWNKDLKLSSTL